MRPAWKEDEEEGEDERKEDEQARAEEGVEDDESLVCLHHPSLSLS